MVDGRGKRKKGHEIKWGLSPERKKNRPSRKKKKTIGRKRRAEDIHQEAGTSTLGKRKAIVS